MAKSGLTRRAADPRSALRAPRSKNWPVLLAGVRVSDWVFPDPRGRLTPAVRLVCRRAEIGDRLALGGASAAVYGQAAGMEGVAGSLKFVRSGAGSPNSACRPTALSCRGGRFG